MISPRFTQRLPGSSRLFRKMNLLTRQEFMTRGCAITYSRCEVILLIRVTPGKLSVEEG
jgi:hypothetical protein